MLYKKIVTVWIASLIAIMVGIWLCSIVVDPLGIWRLTSIQGFNNYKSKQGSYLDIWKPYQYSKAQPDIVYIGSSRVYIGLPTEQCGNKKIYNMGASSLSIKDMRKYISFMYRTHKPEEIYIGLDFFQFGKENYNTERSGFSEDRLENIQQSEHKKLFYQSAESFAFAKYIPITIFNSWKNKNEYTFLSGWDKKKGSAQDVNKNEYYKFINSFMKVYDDWIYEPKAIDDLKAIIDEAKKENVKVQLFFNPISVDLYALLDVVGKLKQFNSIKLQVAEIDEVFDFAYVSEITTNRELFYDASHYKKAIGKVVLNNINQKIEKNKCYLLKPNNNSVDEEVELYQKWKKDNEKYIEVMKKHYISSQIFKMGDLNNFIGF